GMLTILPAMLLFAFAYGLVNRTIDKWFSVQVDGIFGATVALNQEWRSANETMGLITVRQLASALPSNLDEAKRQLGLRALILIASDGRIDNISADRSIQPGILLQSVMTAIGNHQETFADFQDGWLVARRIPTPDGSKILAAVFPAPDRVAELSSTISQQRD